MLRAPEHGGGRVAPDDCKAEHRNRVRDHVEQRGGQRQRERAIERVLAMTPELLVASRASRRCARRNLRDPLEQVAVNAGYQFWIGDWLVVHQLEGNEIAARKEAIDLYI